MFSPDALKMMALAICGICAAAGIALLLLARGGEGDDEPSPYMDFDTVAHQLWLRYVKDYPQDQATQPTVDEETNQKAKVFSSRWDNQAVIDFWKREVVPWRNLFREQSCFSPIIRLLDVLDKHAGCPSIVSAQEDKEARDLAQHWRILSQVTLLDHTMRVTRNIIEIYNSQYQDRMLKGAYIIAALAHDLGKIPEYRKEPAYSMIDHPLISAKILRDKCVGVPFLEQVVKAVRHHHNPKPQDKMTGHLKLADNRAREEELSVYGVEVDLAGDSNIDANSEAAKEGDKFTPVQEGPKSEIPGWLRENLEEILKNVLPHINQPVGFSRYNHRWQAMSTADGICYIDPELLLKKAKEEMDKNKVVDINFIDNSLREKAKNLIADALRERGWLGYGVKGGYYGAYWNCYGYDNEIIMQCYWTPVLIDAFGVLPHELELRKPAGLKAVARVKLSMEAKL